eukprot:CAMPEP_0202388634 /NCGR_PEP_ID=MMETSP1127-20130417/78635_1 /ASSEMBLY_ACC=CAM_ASM_000462 /TAXON_ID=3047 /ORGANISM="Dunaliella tertiolecta, Strain CCMP1320" /LENGTH=161 /DNA_ID=CAMNT_0048990121 /DNA_START=71 /DNA_END=553 /DNA_ORIENTATION=+
MAEEGPHLPAPHSLEALHALIGRQQVDLHFLQDQCRAYEHINSGLRQQLQDSAAQRQAPKPHQSAEQPSLQHKQGRGKKGALMPCERAVDMYKTKYHRYKTICLNLQSRVDRCVHCPHCAANANGYEQQPSAANPSHVVPQRAFAAAPGPKRRASAAAAAA